MLCYETHRFFLVWNLISACDFPDKRADTEYPSNAAATPLILPG